MILKLGGSAFVYCFVELFLDFRWFFILVFFVFEVDEWRAHVANEALRRLRLVRRKLSAKNGKNGKKKRRFQKMRKHQWNLRIFTIQSKTKQPGSLKWTWMTIDSGNFFIFQQRLRNWERREALRCPMDVQFSGAKNCTFAPFIKAEHAEHSQLWKDEMKAHTVCLRNVSPPMSRHWKE